MSTKTAEKVAVPGTAPLKENNALAVVKKKMSVTEKIDSLGKFEALVSKVEYLRECKQKAEQFGNGQDGFTGSKLVLKCSFRDELTVSNPTVVEELVKIANMRLKDLLIKAEKEVEEFEIA